jgi:hypothetical protein
MNIREPADLIRDIREEVIGLLFNRHVFRTHQEIVRLNPRLQGDPRITFARWAQVVYAQSAAAGIRRLAGQDPEQDDVNLVGLLEMFIREPKGLWDCFLRYYPDDAMRARDEILRKEGTLPTGWETLACKRLLGEDRKAVISVAQKAVHFASKRVAHSVPRVPVSTTFSDLDNAIDAIRRITEKYTKLICAKTLQELEPLHRDGKPTIYSWLAHRAKDLDLLEEMKRHKLSKGWDAIFLEAWASREEIERPLGETLPPKLAASGN